jgi:Tol biopolymer transport system component/DNA-binding winged helix-turn-helix (wHTH) protein
MEAGTRSGKPSGVAVFGPFRLDFSTRELTRNGLTLPLEDQPAQVLSLLIERAGILVSRDDLRQLLWPNGVHVDYEHGVHKSINKLRTVLGDDPAAPRLIATLRGRGYRFIGPVEIERNVESDMASASAEQQQQRQTPVPPLLTAEELLLQRIRRRVHPLWAVAALAVIAVAGGAVWLLKMPSRPPEAALVPVPLTAYPGNAGYPTFSPDGSHVAFFWDGGKPGAEGIYVKVIGLEPPVLVAKSPEGYPAWSPDGRLIAFFGRIPSGKPGVFLVPAVGGPVRQLAEAGVTGLGGQGGHFIAWHPSGKWLVAMDKLSPTDSCALFLVLSETGEKRRLTSPPKGSAGDLNPAFSPDGHALVFQRITSGQQDLRILELTDDLKPIAEPRSLTSLYAVDPAWTADGRSVVFAGGAQHRTFLWRLEVRFPWWRPGRLERLPFAGEGALAPAISRQGRLAFMRKPPTDADIWRLEVSGEGPIRKPALRLISSTLAEQTPAYSPDGKRIAFCSMRSGSQEIWVSDSDGGNPLQVTSIGPRYGDPITAQPRWSPDGRWIYFESNIDGRPATYTISADGGRPRPAVDREGAWTSASRDGRWIYFDTDSSGESQVWKKPATGGSAVQVTRHGGGQPFESPDGRFLYYQKPADTPCDPDGCASIWKVPVGGGQEQQIVKSVSCYGMNSAFGDRGVYFNPNDDPPTLQFLNFATNQIEKIANLGENGPACGFSLSPDGHWLIYALYEPTAGSNLMLVENFR